MAPWIILVGLLINAGAQAAETPQPQKTLAQCIDIAIAQHPSLKAAAAAVDAGHERVWEAASNYFPQVSGSYNANRRNTSAAARTGTNVGTQSQTFNFYSTGLTFTQLLFDFGQNLNSIRSAQALQQSLQANATTQLETVMLNVKQSYLNLLTTRRLLAVADETVHQNQQHVEQAQGRYRVGVAAKFDVTQTEVQLANAELNQVTARNNVAVAVETLRNAMGLTAPLDFDIVDTLDVHESTIDEEHAVAIAYDKRPELQSFRAQERALSEQITATQKNYLPNVTGNGAYAWSGTDYPLQSSWNLGASVNLTVLNGGLTAAQVGEAQANLANIKFNEDVERQNIALQARQAVLNLRQAAESIRVATKGQQQARENLAIAEGRYKTGVGNVIELTDAQTSQTTAEANYVNAIYGYQQAVASVENAIAQSLQSGS